MQDKHGTPLAVGDKVLFRLGGLRLAGVVVGQKGPYVTVLHNNGQYGIREWQVKKMAPVEKTGRQK